MVCRRIRYSRYPIPRLFGELPPLCPLENGSEVVGLLEIAHQTHFIRVSLLLTVGVAGGVVNWRLVLAVVHYVNFNTNLFNHPDHFIILLL